MPETEDVAEGIGDTERMATQPFPLDDGTVDPDMPQTQLDLEEGRTSNINRERARQVENLSGTRSHPNPRYSSCSFRHRVLWFL